MPLTLVIGPANSAKAGEVLGAYAAAARRGALLVVPNADDAEHYGRELAGTGAILGSVLTFAGLIAELARRAGYRGRLLTPLQRRHVLRRAVARARLDGLAESARSAGFAGAAGELFAELGRAMVTPQRWTQALEQWSRADPRRASYAQELARLYRAYGAELDRIGRVDAELHVRRALDALRADPGRWGGSPVFLYGFDDLDRAPARRGRDARPRGRRRGHGVAQLRAGTGRVCRPRGGRRGAAPARRARDRAARARSPLRAGQPGRAAPRRAVAVRAPRPSPSIPAMRSACSRPAASWPRPSSWLELCSSGCAPASPETRSPSSPVPRNGEPRCSRGCSTATGSPCTVSRRVPLGDAPLGRGLHALARCAWAEDAHAEDVLAYLRTPGVLERPEIADGLELDLRQAGTGTAADARERLGWSLGEIDGLARAEDPAAELGRHARRLLAAPHRGLAPALDARRGARRPRGGGR